MIHECQLCHNPLKEVGSLRRVKFHKSVLRLCKACRIKVLNSVKEELYNV